MGRHPLAWTAWLAAVATFVAVASNPLYVGTCLAAVLLVALSLPRDASPAGRVVRTFLVLGALFLVVRLLFQAVLVDSGSTTLLTLPEFRVPRLLGGFTVGGPVTAEVLAESAGEGLRLVVVLVAFGILNSAVDFSAVVRALPATFRDTGLVVSIALAFLPGLVQTARDVRDAQRLRGVRGLRHLAPSLVVPILGITLERAFLLAESMDARGYGRLVVRPVSPAATLTGLVAVASGVTAWVAGARAAGSAAVGGGFALLLAALVVAGRRTRVPRAAPRRWGLADTLVAGAAAVVFASALLAPGWFAWSAYPRVRVPAYGVPAAIVPLLLAVPVLVAGTRGRRT